MLGQFSNGRGQVCNLEQHKTERLRKLPRRSARTREVPRCKCLYKGLVPETILRLPYKGKQGLQKNHRLFLPTLSQHISRKALPERSFKIDDRKRERTRTVLLRQQHKGKQGLQTDQNFLPTLPCQHRALPDRERLSSCVKLHHR